MRSEELIKSGLEVCRQLADAGFKPCITGSCWLKIKLPDDEILIDDVDILCQDFDPEHSPVEVEEHVSEKRTRYFCGLDKKVEIIKELSKGIRVEDRDFEVYEGIRYMASNDFWMAAALNKTSNYLSLRLQEDLYWERYKIILPLANCFLARRRGLKIDTKRVAWLMSNHKFTNTRIAHLYNTDLIYIAAVIAERYYFHEMNPPDALVMDFCDQVLKPIAKGMGVYGDECWE